MDLKGFPESCRSLCDLMWLTRAGLPRAAAADRAGGLAVSGGDRHERSKEERSYRTGHQPIRLTTQVRALDLQISLLCSGSFPPSILEPRRQVDHALYVLTMPASISGVSACNVDSIVEALVSRSGNPKVRVSRVSQDIDQLLQAMSVGRSRPLATLTSTCMPLSSLSSWEGPAGLLLGSSRRRGDIGVNTPVAASCSVLRSSKVVR